MELTLEDVLEILEFISRSDIEHCEIEVGGTKIVASKDSAASIVRRAIPRDSSLDQSAADIHSDNSIEQATTATPPADRDNWPEQIDGTVTITAPMVGVYFRAPEPGAPPFTNVGDKVDETSTLGLIEAMKVYTSVTAGVSGQVIDILVEDSQFVEYGQALILIAPETGNE